MKRIALNKISGKGCAVLRTTRLLALPVIVLMSFAACSDDVDTPPATEPPPVVPDPDRVEVLFTSDIETQPVTRASGDFWNAGDEIGVFMVKNGQVLSDDNIAEEGVNRNFRATGSADGGFSPVNANHKLYYPTDDSKVDFIAYHPYRSDSHVADYVYKVDLSDQRADSLFLVYSNNASGYDNKSGKALLEFSHKLAKVTFVISTSDGITKEDIDKMTVSMRGLHTHADFMLADGTFDYTGQPEDFEIFRLPVITPEEPENPEEEGDGEEEETEVEYKYEAVVLPTVGTSGDRSVVFDIPSVGVFTWNIPASVNFQEGYIHNNSVTVSMTGVSVEIEEIEEWKNKGEAAEEGEAKPKEPIIPDETYLGYPNSYIVAPGETLEIPVGKAYAAWSTDARLVSFGDNLEGAQGAKLIWQDVKSLVPAANITMTGEGKTAKIVMSSDAAQGEGAAVIAFTVNGTIYWSWFVWITAYDPNDAAGQKNYNGRIFMDRNLGAIIVSTQIGRSSGSFFQWGRKDAMPGTNNYMSSIRSVFNPDDTGWTQGAKSTTATEDAAENLKTSIQSPEYLIKSGGNWLGLENNDPYLWNKQDGTKGVYDPCPEGWRVPVSGADSQSAWFGLTLPSGANISGNKGVDFPDAGLYRAAGGISSSGTASSIGSSAVYWSSLQSSPSFAYSLFINEEYDMGTYKYVTKMNISRETGCGNSHPVRCVKE